MLGTTGSVQTMATSQIAADLLRPAGDIAVSLGRLALLALLVLVGIRLHE
jgi:hypothetical protein